MIVIIGGFIVSVLLFFTVPLAIALVAEFFQETKGK